jgi:GMP reductase
MRDFLFSYDDITLIPKYSELSTREDADTKIEIFGKEWILPIIPANMQDVISWELANQLSHVDLFYIMHRFYNANYDFIDNWSGEDSGLEFLSISVGITDDSKQELEHISHTKRVPNCLTVDVAHGHHKKVKGMLDWINTYYGTIKPYIIAGNVATADGYKFLCDLGVDAVKVGIGGGSICTTRYKTGFHVPTAYSIWDCVNNSDGYNIPIIADGGIKHFGDIAKAIALGADMVMSGRLFAECIDSPAKINHGQKVYRGSTSYEAKGKNNHIEGQTLMLEGSITYLNRLFEIKQALQSAISYAGGKNLASLRHVEWKLLRP